MKLREMLIVANRLVREKTAAVARPSVAWLADREDPCGPRRPLAPMLVDAAEALQPRAALESGEAAPEYEVLGELGFLLGDRKTVGSEAKPEPSLVRDAPSDLGLLPGNGQTVGNGAEPETGWKITLSGGLGSKRRSCRARGP
jgi:hypothetical protein